MHGETLKYVNGRHFLGCMFEALATVKCSRGNYLQLDGVSAFCCCGYRRVRLSVVD